jgi:hypothetical protein
MLAVAAVSGCDDDTQPTVSQDLAVPVVHDLSSTDMAEHD